MMVMLVVIVQKGVSFRTLVPAENIVHINIFHTIEDIARDLIILLFQLCNDLLDLVPLGGFRTIFFFCIGGKIA